MALSGCGGGSSGAAASGTGGGATTAGATYTIGGTVSGLSAGTGLVLQNNAANDLTVAANSVAFTFPVAQADASAYSVTIKTQPTGRTCAVTSNSGSVAAANVAGIAVTCVSNTQKFGFVANYGNNSVYAFSLDTTTGTALSVGSPITTGLSNPVSVAVDPSGKFLYAANYLSGKVSAFAFNPASGALAVAGSAIASGSGPFAVVVAPNQISNSTAKVVYVANSNDNTVSTFTVNIGTGALTALGVATSTGTLPRAIAVDPLGKFAYVANQDSADISVYTIDSTGALAAAGGAVSTGTHTLATTKPQSVMFHPNAQFLYVANTGDNTISSFTVNAGGLLSVKNDIAAAGGPNTIAIDPTGAFLYVATNNGGILGYTINSTTGLLTAMSGIPFGNPANNFGSISVNAGSTYVYATNTTTGKLEVFSIAAATGILTDLATPVTIPSGTGALFLPIVTTR